ncbi:hypothetical protein StrepF001_05315 [Streptomyces sp. F001]|uniref:hypothetical protein n=1 Tax=Streptomyces sp. F001 TaxID=1510026 RepID=UPI00101E41B0|nr:hypothetical protein [Streptomyces sp. F001]RZB20959.1 hypothetical protein StrepF001_05315 [Streptomyces sp. F001]
MVLGSDLRRGNARRRAALAAALLLFLAPALAACSDDEGGGSDSPPPTPAVEQTQPTDQAASAPADTAAAEREIRQNWEQFFDPATALEDKQNFLENGGRMAPVLQAFSGDERGSQVQAKVDKVEFTSATEANVTYTLTLQGATALPDAAGTAVEQEGTWKVSVRTLCGLVALNQTGNATPLPGC